MQPHRLINYSSPLNRNYSPHKGIQLRLLAIPDLNCGTVWKNLAGTNDGILTNFTPATVQSWGSIPRPGGFSGLIFDGVNDYINLGVLPAANNGTTFTFSIWAKFLTLNGGIFNDRNSAASWAFSCNSGNLQIFVSSWNAFSTTITSNVWTHITLVYVPGTASVYVNGLLNSTISLTLSSGGAFESIGAWDSGATSSPSAIYDDACFWSRALAAAEIYDLWQDSNTGYQRSLNYKPLRQIRVAPKTSPFQTILFGQTF